MASPAVPAVIRVEDDAVSIVSAIDSQRPLSATKVKGRKASTTTAAVGANGHPPPQRPPVVSLNGQTKRVLSHSRYQETLGSIIQRDYFPSPLVVAPVVSVVTDLSVLVPTGGNIGTTLTQFHAGAASDRQVDFHQQLADHGRHHREHVENTKYMYAGGSKEQNAVFYPVIPHHQSSQQQPNRAMIEALQSTSDASSSSSSFLVPSSNRTIVPDATRFPQPMIRKPMVQPQLHWESDNCSTTTIADDPSSNGYTDLDSTIVLSLRSEIRRGRQRKLRESSGHNHKSVVSSSSSALHRRRKRVRPPLDSDESIGYALRKAYKRPKPSSSSSAAGSTAASVKR